MSTGASNTGGEPVCSRQRIIGRVQPPPRRIGGLHEIEFGLREPAP